VKSPVCEIPAQILAFPGLVKCPAIGQKYRNFWRQVARTDAADSFRDRFPLPDKPELPDRLDCSPDAQAH
jgi:hypothetical protein